MAILSFLSGLRGLARGGGNEFDTRWNIPESEEDIDRLLENSRPQLIYKHSFACGVCVFSKSAIESEFEKLSEMADLHFVDVRASRNISNYIAEKTGVRHESPQAIILKKGQVSWHASHGGIKSEKITENIKP